MGITLSAALMKQSALAKWILGVLLMIAPPSKLAAQVPGETVEEMTARYEITAQNMAEVIHERGPIFRGANGEYKTAATMIGIAKFESELAKDVAIGKRRGDHGKSWCYMQIMIVGKKNIWGDDEMKTWTGQDLVDDWKKCFAVGYEIIKYSVRSCWNYKNGDILSGYTTGKCKQNEKKARHRWNYAQWILRAHPAPAAPILEILPAAPDEQTTLL
jgi:hypothetical protein